MVAVAGVIVTEATGTGVTVIVEGPLFPSLVAVIVAVPAALPVTSPLAVTVATAVLLLPQLTVRPDNGLPLASRLSCDGGAADFGGSRGWDAPAEHPPGAADAVGDVRGRGGRPGGSRRRGCGRRRAGHRRGRPPPGVDGTGSLRRQPVGHL